MSKHLTPANMEIGGCYRFPYETQLLRYMGARRYAGDSRRWHQFAKVEVPLMVWCEVLDKNLDMFEEVLTNE